jgi:hypothetical protein
LTSVGSGGLVCVQDSGSNDGFQIAAVQDQD